MSVYFHDRKRRLGVMALALACVLTAGWIRSRLVSDQVTVAQYSSRHQFTSSRGEIHWESWPVDVAWIPRNERIQFSTQDLDLTAADPINWKPLQAWDYQGFSLGPHTWTIAYSSIVIPLTLLSACLLLSEPSSESLMFREDPFAQKHAHRNLQVCAK